MKERNYLLLVISHLLIGAGFFFLYVCFVRSVFESRTRFSTLSQLQRESLLRKEDALYFTFYKAITDEPDFVQGYERLLNMTNIEYPNSVNVMQRFHVLPELVIGYLYHSMRRISRKLEIPILTCWTLDEGSVSQPQITCDGIGEPHQFYLEFVWILGGFTVFIMYMYGSFLSENVFGGIYTVVSYIMFHKNASKIYERPVARENFAFPFIFWQMFYLCVTIESAGREKEQKSFRPTEILKFTILTSISLLCWQFSSIIFATQILIMITPWSLGLVSSTFAVDYSISQFLANIVAYYFSYGNKKYFFAWQNGPAFALFFISLVGLYKSQFRSESSMKSITLGILLAVSSQGTIIDLLEKSGYARAEDNPYTVYRDLILHWGLQRKVNFTTSLLACSSDFAQKDLNDVWQLVKTMFVKPYCLYGVVMLTKFFRKWRKKDALPANTDQVERAMKYVLEDFLEENHISMQEINNIETGKELGDCLKILEECNFDYEKYKLEKSKTKKSKINQHDEFFSDIKRLKKQINAINEQKNKENNTNNIKFSFEAIKEENEKQKPSEKEEEPLTETEILNVEEKIIEVDNTDNKEDITQETTSENAEDKSSEKVEDSSKAEDNVEDSSKSEPRTTNKQKSHSETVTTGCGDFLSYHYLYSVCQLAIFAVIGLSIKKLFFLCYTQGCVMAPTVCCKFWNQKQRHIFWTISLAVFVTSILDAGIVNVHEEYFPTERDPESLESMLEWINMNTERDAVFGGPIDIIGTVHLATKRPIVNHAHLDMQQISDRTEHIYSVLSRQQSSDIYNQCSQLKIQYLIISFTDCVDSAKNECDILTIWDEMQPAYRKYPQFCSELLYKNVPSFLKVFSNDKYAIIKMFSQSLQINLKYTKMPEKFM